MYREILDVFAQRGWCRGQVENEHGNVCLVGARNVVLDGDARSRSFGDHTGFDKLIKRVCTSPWIFNDLTAKSEEAVMSVLRELALEEEVDDAITCERDLVNA